MGASQSSPAKSKPPQQNSQSALPRGASPRNASHFSWRSKKTSRANQAELPFGERLVAAAEDGDMNSLQRLHTDGADVNTVGPFGRTLLLAACRHGRTSMVKWLLTVHADPNQTNDAGVTPLHMAAAHNHAAAVQLLLDAGSNIATTDNSGGNGSGRTALEWALSNNAQSAAKLIENSLLKTTQAI